MTCISLLSFHTFLVFNGRLLSARVELIEIQTCTHSHYLTVPIVNCSLPLEPCNGGIVDYERLNEIVSEETVLTYQCDSRLSLTGPNNVTCTNAGVWSTEPEAIICVLMTEGDELCNCLLSTIFHLTVSTVAPLFSTSATVAISVVITFILTLVIGFLTGLLVMHVFSHKKAVYSPATEGQVNVGPTTLAGPVYEEVSPKEKIELNTN